MSRQDPGAATDRCASVEPLEDRRCEFRAGHGGVHRNAEVRGDTTTWGTVTQVRAYLRDEESPDVAK